MKRLLIIGSSGFMGAHLVSHIAERSVDKYEVFGADVNELKGKPNGLKEFCSIDATDGMAINMLLKEIEPDFVVNLAGTFGASVYKDYLRINVDISRHLLESCLNLKRRPEKILIIGSAAEYGITASNPLDESAETRPVTLYGLSKLMQTQVSLYYHDAFNLPVIIARTFNVTGEGISPLLSVGSFGEQIAAAKDGDSIRVGSLKADRDFLPVQTVVERYMVLLERGKPGTVYNVCSGKPQKMLAVVERMIRESGKRIKFIEDPAKVKKNDVPCIYGSTARFDELMADYPGKTSACPQL